MCTVLVMNPVHRDLPVVIGANRDEFYARPASGPQELAPGIFGGRDLTAGGTWMAVTPGGFFAALTNHHTGAPADRSRRSRGEIVVSALAAAGPRGDLDAAARYLATLDPRDYNPFNLLFGHAGGLRVAYARAAGSLAPAEVPAGVHALLTDRLVSLEQPPVDLPPKLAAPFRDLPRAAGAVWADLAPELRRLMSDHSHPDLAAMCIHTPLYGTRSSSLLALAPGRVIAYHHADGPPCTTEYRDFTTLLTL